MDDKPDAVVAVAPAGPIEELDDESEDVRLDWFVLKVQSQSRAFDPRLELLKRKVKPSKVSTEFFGEIVDPDGEGCRVQRAAGRRRVVNRKICFRATSMIHMERQRRHVVPRCGIRAEHW